MNKRSTANYKVIEDEEGRCYQFFCDLSGACACTTKRVRADTAEEELQIAWATEGRKHFNVCHRCGRFVLDMMYNADVLECVECAPWENVPNYCPHCGEKLSDPQKECPECGKRLRTQVHNPYFDEIRFQLNDSTVEIEKTVGVFNPERNMEYRRYKEMGEEMKEALLQIRQEVRDKAEAEAAPKMAVQCPYCGATTTTDKAGCCEYCGGAISN